MAAPVPDYKSSVNVLTGQQPPTPTANGKILKNEVVCIVYLVQWTYHKSTCFFKVAEFSCTPDAEWVEKIANIRHRKGYRTTVCYHFQSKCIRHKDLFAVCYPALELSPLTPTEDCRNQPLSAVFCTTVVYNHKFLLHA